MTNYLLRRVILLIVRTRHLPKNKENKEMGGFMIHPRTPLLSVTKLLVAVLLVLLVAGAILACDNLLSSSDSNDKDNGTENGTENGNGDNGGDLLTSVPESWNGSYALQATPTVAVMEIASGTITVAGTQLFPVLDGGA